MSRARWISLNHLILERLLRVSKYVGYLFVRFPGKDRLTLLVWCSFILQMPATVEEARSLIERFVVLFFVTFRYLYLTQLYLIGSRALSLVRMIRFASFFFTPR